MLTDEQLDAMEGLAGRLRVPSYWKSSDGYTEMYDSTPTQAADALTTLIAAAREGVRMRAENERMRAAINETLTHRSSTFKARNGRDVGIQGDDGEKVWLVHSDYITGLQAALNEGENWQQTEAERTKAAIDATLTKVCAWLRSRRIVAGAYEDTARSIENREFER